MLPTAALQAGQGSSVGNAGPATSGASGGVQGNVTISTGSSKAAGGDGASNQGGGINQAVLWALVGVAALGVVVVLLKR